MPIARALANLRAHGFLDWLRRYEPTGREGRGPQVRQTSNAYLPARALRLLGRLMQAPPVPEGVLHTHTQRTSEVATYTASLPLDELPLLEIEDSRLGRLLAQLGRSVRKRESARPSET